MLTAVVTTRSAGVVEVVLHGQLGADDETEEFPEGACERTDLDGDPITTDCPELNPIAPEVKEVVWGFGAFVVLVLALRFWLFPKLREGMTQRYEKIQGDKESAETLTAAARADVAEYEARLASVRAEAQQKVDAARATLEAERSERLAEVNAAIAQRRAAAAEQVDAARTAALGDVESAVTDVVRRGAEIALGREPDGDAVRAAVRAAMGAEVAR